MTGARVPGQVNITVINGARQIGFSEWIHVKTKPLPPTAPVLKLLEVHPTSVKLQWTDSNNKYMLQRHSKGLVTLKEKVDL